LTIHKTLKKESIASIFIVSDATGGTAQRMVRSALVQFGDAHVDLIQRAHVISKQGIKAVVKEAFNKKALIIHTLASSDLRECMLRESRLLRVDAMDLMGPMLDRLSVFIKVPPKEEPGLYRHLSEGKPREIEAVAFAFHHDDGQGLDDIDKAELVIVGVSRSMKTPTMLYLAYHGWFTANVPLIMEIAPAPELLSLSPDKVFCLVPSENQLIEIRRTRATIYGFPPSLYTAGDYIRNELTFARRICRENNWRILETPGKSIEEISREIVELHMPGGHLQRNARGFNPMPVEHS